MGLPPVPARLWTAPAGAAFSNEKPKVKLRAATALRSRARHERPHNKKDGGNEKRGDEDVSHKKGAAN